MINPVLSVRNLIVEIPTRRAVLRAVDQVSFDIKAGEILGVVGESGAGKSMTGNAVIGLLNRPARIAGGEIHLNGKRIDNLSKDQIRQLRGSEIGMVFQDPLTSLNPLIPIGEQLTETILEHLPVSKSEALDRAVAALDDVGIPAAAERIGSYPHQFSGGMRQRVVIALALCAEPSLLIADEPTTALDVSVQAQIISLLKQLCRSRGTAVMLITHDMGVIAEATDRVAVLYAGRLAELGDVRQVLTAPQHPYTQGLVASTPVASNAPRNILENTPENTLGKASGAGQRERLVQIPGNMPRLDQLPQGCAFHPRCEIAQKKCRNTPVPTIELCGGTAACWFAGEKPTGEFS